MSFVRAHRLVLAALGLAALGSAAVIPAPAGLARSDNGAATDVYLTGQLLVAAPQILDPRFQKTLVYMIAHDGQGAFGLIVNRATGKASLKNFLKGFGIEGGEASGDLVVHYGGPVETGLGFVLHTAEFESPQSRKVAGPFAWSPAPAAIEAASRGTGPKRYLFTLGYAGWGPRQLEGEIERGDWLIAPADETLVFELKGDAAWEKARARAGVRL
ncbi:MAG: YqgE/AlgH family protein [Pseudomonadota bacterium]